MFWISFQSDGKYFVFNDKGKTIRKDIETKAEAQMFVLQRSWRNRP